MEWNSAPPQAGTMERQRERTLKKGEKLTAPKEKKALIFTFLCEYAVFYCRY